MDDIWVLLLVSGTKHLKSWEFPEEEWCALLPVVGLFYTPKFRLMGFQEGPLDSQKSGWSLIRPNDLKAGTFSLPANF